MIELRNIEKSFGKTPVLTGIDLHVARGEHMLLTGPSGSGKSTLLRIVAGLEAPTRGEVFLMGRQAGRDNEILMPPKQRAVSMVFQDLGLWPNLTTLDNVQLALAGVNESRKAKRKRAGDSLASFALTGLEGRKPAQLSAGQQQRAALARAFAASPRILLLDEPFAGLDLLLKEEIFDIIKCQCDSEGITTITVSHQPSDAFALGVDRVAVIEDGKLVETVSVEELRTGIGNSRTLRAWGRYRDS